MKVLVKQAQRGNADAFISLIEENRQSLQRVAYGFFQNEEDVADAIQDTILDAFEHIGDLKKADLFKTWLIRILINNCNQIFNHNKKNYYTDTMPEREDTAATGSSVEFMELLTALPSDGEQFTTKEIGNILHMNESTVKSRLHRGKEQLRSQLQSV